MKLDSTQMAQLAKLQQGELDASLMYKRLAEAAKSDVHKAILKKIAADEGKHAGIARKYTGLSLKPRTTTATVIRLAARVVGSRAVYRFLSKAENSAGESLKWLLDTISEGHEIIADEIAHGRQLEELAAG